jgi:hypothetical protein
VIVVCEALTKLILQEAEKPTDYLFMFLGTVIDEALTFHSYHTHLCINGYFLDYKHSISEPIAIYS